MVFNADHPPALQPPIVFPFCPFVQKSPSQSSAHPRLRVSSSLPFPSRAPCPSLSCLSFSSRSCSFRPQGAPHFVLLPSYFFLRHPAAETASSAKPIYRPPRSRFPVQINPPSTILSFHHALRPCSRHVHRPPNLRNATANSSLVRAARSESSPHRPQGAPQTRHSQLATRHCARRALSSLVSACPRVRKAGSNWANPRLRRGFAHFCLVCLSGGRL